MIGMLWFISKVCKYRKCLCTSLINWNLNKFCTLDGSILHKSKSLDCSSMAVLVLIPCTLYQVGGVYTKVYDQLENGFFVFKWWFSFGRFDHNGA